MAGPSCASCMAGPTNGINLEVKLLLCCVQHAKALEWNSGTDDQGRE